MWWKLWRSRDSASRASEGGSPVAAAEGNDGWTIVAASEAGTSHHRRGVPCEDAFAFEKGRDGSAVLAVADGAGSSRFGAIGAEIAVRVAVAAARRQLGSSPASTQENSEGLVREVLAVCRGALEEAVAGLLHETVGPPEPRALVKVSPAVALAAQILEKRWCPTADRTDSSREMRSRGAITLADFHTTLALAVLGPEWSAFGNIGDGWIVARLRGEPARAIATTAKGEFIEETFFLDSPNALEEAACAVLPTPDLDGVALLTDGAAWFSIDLGRKAPGQALFEALFAVAVDSAVPQEEKEAELKGLLTSERVCRLTDDDKTILIAARGMTTVLSTGGTALV